MGFYQMKTFNNMVNDLQCVMSFKTLIYLLEVVKNTG